jgi:hypothetical protein
LYVKPEYRHLLNKENPEPVQEELFPELPENTKDQEPQKREPDTASVWAYENNDDIGTLDERRHIAETGGGFPPMQKRLAKDRDLYLVELLASNPYLDVEVRELLKSHPVLWVRRLAHRTPVAPEDQSWVVGRTDGGRIW